MKTLLVTISEPTAVRNILRGRLWEIFAGASDLRIVLVLPPHMEAIYGAEFAGTNIVVESLSPAKFSWQERIISYLTRNTLHSPTVQMNQWREYYERKELGKLLCKRVFWWLGPVVWFLPSSLRHWDLSLTPTQEIRHLFDTYQPAAVFSTITQDEGINLPILREARRRGVYSFGMMRGWDNFSNYGYVRIVPDHFFLQNEYLYESAKKFQKFPQHTTFSVVGFPQMDWYFRKELIIPRETFLKGLGIDPSKRVILYGALGDYLFPREGDISELFETLVDQGKLPGDLVMIFRAHPQFTSPLDRMESMRHVVPDRNALYRGAGLTEWDMGEREFQHLMNSIYHSEFVITSASTMALDAVALGKPAISVAFEKTSMPYWLSGRRFRCHFEHYQELMKTGGVFRADTPEALLGGIEQYLRNPYANEEGRKELSRRFLLPLDGHSSEQIANTILRKLSV